MAKLLDAYPVEPDAVQADVMLSPPGHQALMLRACAQPAAAHARPLRAALAA